MYRVSQQKSAQGKHSVFPMAHFAQRIQTTKKNQGLRHAVCLTIYQLGISRQTGMTMSKPDNENLKKLLRLTREMLALSDEGDRDRRDGTCGIIYGILRDAAYRIKKLVEKERDEHKDNGTWD